MDKGGEVNFGDKMTWECLKERFQAHVSRHLNQYKLSRPNIWRVEESLGITDRGYHYVHGHRYGGWFIWCVRHKIRAEDFEEMYINVNPSTSSTELDEWILWTQAGF